MRCAEQIAFVRIHDVSTRAIFTWNIFSRNVTFARSRTWSISTCTMQTSAPIQMERRSTLVGKILDLPRSQSGRAIMLVQTRTVVGLEDNDDDREMSCFEKEPCVSWDEWKSECVENRRMAMRRAPASYCKTVVPVELYRRIKSACRRNTRSAASSGNCSWSSDTFYVSTPLHSLVRSGFFLRCRCLFLSFRENLPSNTMYFIVFSWATTDVAGSLKNSLGG